MDWRGLIWAGSGRNERRLKTVISGMKLMNEKREEGVVFGFKAEKIRAVSLIRLTAGFSKKNTN
jgi:hypothetical protein